MTDNLKPPRWPHGQRLLIPFIDDLAQSDPERPWVSVPVDESDLSKGYRDITYKEFVSASNIAARWLQDNLNLPENGFPSFAYAGPRDLRYAFFALAAGKLGYQIILPASTITAAGQKRILEQKQCSVYLHGDHSITLIEDLLKLVPSFRSVSSPGLDYFFQEETNQPITYRKTWPDGRNDPWLVFHTSGTTGFPKVVTYTQNMLSTFDVVAGFDDRDQTHLAQFQNSRSYMPVPIMHFVAMNMILGVAPFGYTVPIFGPVRELPTPALVKQILKHARADGMTLSPALLDALCQDEESLQVIRKLKYAKYAGASMSVRTGKLLAPYIHLSPAIGSTDAGPYYISLPNTKEDWDYVVFQPHAGVVLEHRIDNLYELVYVKDPKCLMQTVFEAFPELDRFETKDLWTEHPYKRGHWKFVGRLDDFVKLSNGSGLFVAPVESTIAEHPQVKSVIIGGQGLARPVVLLELTHDTAAQAELEEHEKVLRASIEPYIDKANVMCHDSVKLDNRLIVLAVPEKPWPRTMKDTVIRSQTLHLYNEEIRNEYQRAGYSI